MAETRNIVILGAGFAGLSVGHYFMKHVVPTLKKDSSASYRLIFVDQSTQFWWHIAAPRELIAPKLTPHSKTFFPLADGFKQYGADKDIVTFHHAQPTGVDFEGRTVTIKNVTPDSDASDNVPTHTETIHYYSLIIATGTRTPTPVTSLHGDHTITLKALDALHQRLSKATSVILSGGGPVGVETAGEIGQALNGRAGFMQSRPANSKVKITLITGGKKLLPVLPEGIASKAAKHLGRVGVDVIYSKRVTKVDEPAQEDGKTTVHLEDGTTLETDVYIPAIGATPNSEFLPKNILNDKGFVHTNATSLRVEGAGDRVYAVGDIGDYTRGGVLEIFAAVPVLGANVAHDLGVYPDGKGTKVPDKSFKADVSETQVVPVGSKGGVGAFKGFSLPTMMVKMIKGNDFGLSQTDDIILGTKWAKA